MVWRLTVTWGLSFGRENIAPYIFYYIGVGDPEKGVWGRVDKWQGLHESWGLQATRTGQMCDMAPPVCSLILWSILLQIKHSLKKGFIDDNTAFFINETKTSCRLRSKIWGYLIKKETSSSNIRKEKIWKVININYSFGVHSFGEKPE